MLKCSINSISTSRVSGEQEHPFLAGLGDLWAHFWHHPTRLHSVWLTDGPHPWGTNWERNGRFCCGIWQFYWPFWGILHPSIESAARIQSKWFTCPVPSHDTMSSLLWLCRLGQFLPAHKDCSLPAGGQRCLYRKDVHFKLMDQRGVEWCYCIRLRPS